MTNLEKKEYVALEILKTLIPNNKDIPSETPADMVKLSCDMAELLIEESKKDAQNKQTI